jgi:hypothetical protein
MKMRRVQRTDYESLRWEGNVRLFPSQPQEPALRGFRKIINEAKEARGQRCSGVGECIVEAGVVVVENLNTMLGAKYPRSYAKAAQRAAESSPQRTWPPRAAQELSTGRRDRPRDCAPTGWPSAKVQLCHMDSKRSTT